MNEYGEIIRNSSPPPPIPPHRNSDPDRHYGCLIGIIISIVIIAVIFAAKTILNKSDDADSMNSQFVETTTDIIGNDSDETLEHADNITAEVLCDIFQYGGHSYRLYRFYDITANDIIDYCYNQGGYLAHINDEQENQFLASMIGTLGYDIVYFGYSDEQSEGDWYWIDGEYSSFVNWRSGEPNNEANEEHYALISPDGTWNDGKLEIDSRSGVNILCEWNTLFESNASIQPISDYKTHISNISSSSHLANEIYGNKTYVYSAEKAFDSDMTTCWSEGVDGYGVGETITVYFDDVYEISEISLWNGLCTSEDLFYKNSRLHNITVVLSNGNSYNFEYSDGWDNRNNSFSFEKSIETSSLTIIIQSVYEGNKYKDTCISEICIS